MSKATQKPTTFDEMTDADLERIREETLALDAVSPRARTVHYDSKKDTLVLELKNGMVMLIPTRLLQGIAGSDPRQIAKVETDERGYGVHFPALDQDFSVEGLLAGCFGSKRWMEELRASGDLSPAGPSASEMGRKGGKASTHAKRVSSRENGKLGGRPRKKIAA